MIETIIEHASLTLEVFSRSDTAAANGIIGLDYSAPVLNPRLGWRRVLHPRTASNISRALELS